MADLQRFSANRGCPKCGCLDLAVQWMPAAEYRSPWEGKERREHIQRHCRRCHYQWNEAPLIADPAPSESGERALGWRQGVLDAAEFLRHAWDDGEQGNHNDAAELVLLRHYAERGPSPGDANSSREEETP